ncbi:hypothetical protein VP468E531_P0061 [Vibrio phage 468E53-1]|nr:hypothetical protein VP468E531_P0061 [Vibrio phage 468E53-1]CAH9016078.1 hypothetical protein VP177E371_P0060 [Vibrio phage 177E37-1]
MSVVRIKPCNFPNLSTSYEDNLMQFIAGT